MCVRGWKGKTKWNPAGIEVVTQGKIESPSNCSVELNTRVEYKHSPESFDFRGGALTLVLCLCSSGHADHNSADHVDILGSSPLNAAILKIAAGRGDLVTDQIQSDIIEYTDKMNWE